MKTPRVKKERKKLRDTKFGIWLKEHDTELLDLLGNLIPDKKGWRIVKRILERLEDLSDDKKAEANQFIEAEISKND